MNSIDIELYKVENSQHRLTSARRQLNLLARLLSEYSTTMPQKSGEDLDLSDALEDIFSQVQLVMQKIDTLYQCVSTEFQLPGDGFVRHFEESEF